MQGLRQRVENELLSNILPFWLKYTIDDQIWRVSRADRERSND